MGVKFTLALFFNNTLIVYVTHIWCLKYLVQAEVHNIIAGLPLTDRSYKIMREAETLGPKNIFTTSL